MVPSCDCYLLTIKIILQWLLAENFILLQITMRIKNWVREEYAKCFT
jgi:hypothetical protein